MLSGLVVISLQEKDGTVATVGFTYPLRIATSFPPFSFVVVLVGYIIYIKS